MSDEDEQMRFRYANAAPRRAAYRTALESADPSLQELLLGEVDEDGDILLGSDAPNGWSSISAPCRPSMGSLTASSRLSDRPPATRRASGRHCQLPPLGPAPPEPVGADPVPHYAEADEGDYLDAGASVITAGRAIWAFAAF